MSAQPNLLLHATPSLNIYDPSGQPIHQPEVPKIVVNRDKEKSKEESPPMFKCGDRLCIFAGDDYYHLPKEMDISHWEGDLGDLYNFKQLPYGDWPTKIPNAYLDNAESVQADVQMSDNGDFEPMELFKHYHELQPNPKEKTFFETVADADEDGDDEMMDFIQTQVSTTQTALSVSDLESDSFHVTTSSNGALCPISSSKSNSLVISPESASSLANNNSDASAASLSINSGDNDKPGRSPSQAVSQSYSNVTSSYHSESMLSSYQILDYQGSAGDISSSTSPTAVTDEGIASHAQSTMTFRSGNLDHFVESLDEKVTESTEFIETEAEASISQSPTSLQEYQASTTDVESERPETVSPQESFPSSHSTFHSTSTDEPGVITPDLHPSRLNVTIEKHDGPCSTPPLSPDNDVSMVADTTIGTINSVENLFFNGDLAMKSAMDLSSTKTDSEEEEGSDDEDVPGIPLLLFDQTARLASMQGSAPNHQYRAGLPVKVNGQPSDFFSPAEVKLPKTPQPSRKSDQSRQRGTTAPAPLQSAFKMAPSYQSPKHRERPFFPNKISDSRRAGTEEPSPSSAFPEQHGPNHDVTPSRPLFLLANAAVDAADGSAAGDDTWPRSGTVMDLGDQSQQTSTPSLASSAVVNNSADFPFHRSSLTTAPSPSEVIWQKGHVVKASKTSTSASPGRRGFVPPAPKAQGGVVRSEIIRTVPPPTPSAKQIPRSSRSRQTPVAGRQALVPAQSNDSVATHFDSPSISHKTRVQLSSPVKVWRPAVECGNFVQRTNSAGLKPNRRFGYTPSEVLQEDTVRLRQVRDERSPSDSPEPETLDSSVPMDMDLPQESQQTVSSADSGLMGRAIARSLLTPPPLITVPARLRGRGRGGGRARGRGRGIGRGMTRASTSAGRQSSAKPDNDIAGAKRKPEDEDISEVSVKKIKSTRGRSKSVSGPSRKAYPEVDESRPFQKASLIEADITVAHVPPVDVAAPIDTVATMEDVPLTEDPIVDTREFIAEPELGVASGSIPAQTRYSASTSTRSSVLPPPTPAAELDSEAELGGSESPDPIALVPGDDLEVKQEALDNHHDRLEPGKGTGRRAVHPRQYSNLELAIILNTLGPDKALWDRSKSKMKEICENLSNGGYMVRTPGAMKYKVKELLGGKK